MMSTEEILRLTVAALMTRTGERQGDLAAGLGQSQAQVSRKQAGRAHWSLEDVDLLAAHYRLHVLDLLAGPTHAVGVLHGAVPSVVPGSLAPLAVPPAQGSLPDRQPAAPAPAPEREPVGRCVLCGGPAFDDVDGYPQHLDPADCSALAAAAQDAPATKPSAAADAPATAPEPDPPVAAPAPPAPAEMPTAAPPTPVAAPPAAPPTPPAPSSVPVNSRQPAPGYASTNLVEQITDRVHEVLAECSGDVDAAQAALIKAAIPDVMALLKSSRVGGRYEHSEFPPTAEILRKKSQKGADEIWEGRPKWRNSELFAAAKKGELIEVTALDMNAAYCSALKCWLPIGQLREDTSGVHDPKKAGVHLITPATWEHTDLPNPLGHRIEPGELWVTESTLRLLLDCARQGLADTPAIHRSLVSGASEALLEKLRRALAESRKNALAEGDELTVAYVKAMYSKFVSTIGESSANREIRRPDWMHIIRAKAFANLWMKAHKAHRSGLQVVEISGTDELHVAGDWRSVFAEGRDLNQVKEKDTYTLGGRR
ncbi:acyltransferase [Streptomyces sp. P9(2023)]|uniref:acyltransferase n=1 Tax=Streptomyces sp. P9(2023) TaxID=3064394 RepID=UPI0028F40B40|nr:acyltransferase [Streptomyces sp. P9(2023)]MDT9692747.1 acyltransferase [Streptomyces sp. P9(2023)]